MADAPVAAPRELLLPPLARDATLTVPALMVVAPFVLFPFTKTLFLAFDLVFRPADS